MIKIENCSFLPTPNGESKYRLSINDTTVCVFAHIRSDGLASLLRKAADEIDKKESNQ